MTVAIVVAMQQDLKQIMKQFRKNKKFLYQKMQQKFSSLAAIDRGVYDPVFILYKKKTRRKLENFME
jgi:hypothetical protein